MNDDSSIVVEENEDDRSPLQRAKGALASTAWRAERIAWLRKELEALELEAFDTANVSRVKRVQRYGDERVVRVYYDHFDGSEPYTCEYPDPTGAVYEAFKKAGISAS